MAEIVDPEKIVAFAEAAHASRDVARVLECFEDDVVALWNGRCIAHDKAELSDWYHRFFDAQQAFELSKTLRAASGNVLAVEWQHRRTDASGARFEAHAAEIWWVSPNRRLIRWHAHCTEYPLDE